MKRHLITEQQKQKDNFCAMTESKIATMDHERLIYELQYKDAELVNKKRKSADLTENSQRAKIPLYKLEKKLKRSHRAIRGT